MVSLMFTWGNLRFPCGFPYVYIGKPGFPCGFPHVSLWKPGVSMWFPPIFHMGKPLVDPSFHAMEACKPERRVFPLEGKRKKVVSRMETPWKSVVNLWFPCGFPYVSP